MYESVRQQASVTGQFVHVGCTTHIYKHLYKYLHVCVCACLVAHLGRTHAVNMYTGLSNMTTNATFICLDGEYI